MNNQLCKVCGEQAAGFHFGAFTCEGCKSFFGRTYNNLSSISDCKNNGECVINKKNRTSCKACRLRKCFFVGMSKSGSRYGRRSNWFKYQYLFPGQGGSTGGPASHSNWDEDNNNVKKDPPLWRLPPIPGMPLFGFTPPLTPFFLSRGLPLQVPPSLTPPLVPPPPSPAIQQHAPSHNPVDHLRSLGPVQDSPMDLRLKKSTPSPRRLSPPSTFSSSQGLQNMPHHRHSPPLQHPIAQSDKQGPLNMSCIKIE